MSKVNVSSPLLLRCRLVLILTLQGALIFCSLLAAWLLRFEFRLPNPGLLWTAALVLVAVRLTAMPLFHLMHGWWTYTGIRDAIDILQAIFTGSLGFCLVMRYGLGLKSFPASIYPLEALITFLLLAGVRVFSRMLAETVRRDSCSKRLLLVGAGRAAQMIIRETREAGSAYQVIGCVDDSPLKKGLRVLGVRVLGRVDALPRLANRHRIDEILIAIPSAAQTQMVRLVAICKEAGIPFRTVPAMAELISGRVTLQQVREVSLNDLLGRVPVELDLESVREHIRDRVIMVTGAAGSIGSELCRQIRRYHPKLLVCADHNETGIFHLQRELALSGEQERNIFRVADICNAEAMHRTFLKFGVEIVFHAAGYKHVPVMEDNIEEAINNNVFGLLSLLSAAQRSNCSTFVMISSDKAVNPTSVMGCTKRIGELLLSAYPERGMRCVSVRFGNVLGSNGSVIPLFQEQLRQNLPITITHPGVTRFFMTITEAVSLVLQGFAIGRHGDTLVLDMGQPMLITELAKTLVRLSGKSDHEFKFIGLRPGEKLFEELFYPQEQVFPSACDRIFSVEGIRLAWSSLKRDLEDLYAAVSFGKRGVILEHLRRIVPQFSYVGSDSTTGSENAVMRTVSAEIRQEVQLLADIPPVRYRTWLTKSFSGPSPDGGPQS